MSLPRTDDAHVELRGISKRYEGIHALKGVSMSVRRGTVHALVGENGAGKSTLGKIIGGAVVPDDGTLVVDGETIVFHTPREALLGGIALVHQEIALAPGLSVLDNVSLGAEDRIAGLVRLGGHRERFAELMEQTGFDIDPDIKASRLPVSEQQKVEIARALARDATLIVLDEPTAALTRDESRRLLDLVRSLRSRGTTIVYVSHNLEDVLSLADEVTVLKDGNLMSSGAAQDETVETLVSRMLGRSLSAIFPPKLPPPETDEAVLRVTRLTRKGLFEDVSFDVRPGEIVGMAGLVGSGRTELARAIFGADPYDSGAIELNGRPVRIRTPHQAVRHGIAMLPEARKEQGLMMFSSIRANITVTCMDQVTRGGFLRSRVETAIATRAAEQVDVRMRDLDMPVANLSGGNQQKVVIAKWLLRKPALLIADEPTRGVDVGARFTIYELLRSLAEDGLGVLLISSELEEVMGMAHRILVMHRGRLIEELPGDAQEDHILSLAFGQRTITKETP